MRRISLRIWCRYVRDAARRRRQDRKRRLSRGWASRTDRAPNAHMLTPDPKRLVAIKFAEKLPRFRINRRSPWLIHLTAPPALHFGEDHASVAEFGHGIGTLFAGEVHPYLDFTPVRKAGPAAALYIAAEIERWQQHHPQWRRPIVYDFDKWDPAIRRYFGDLGLYDLLRVRNPPHEMSTPGELRILKMRRKNLIDADSVTALRDELQLLCRIPNRMGFFDALSEAMNNVSHHAYKNPDSRQWPRLENHWWMTADYDPGNSSLRVAFLDQGVGIPARLRLSGLEAVEGLFTRFRLNSDDAGHIEVAMRYGRSSTGQEGRGRGFHDMQMFVDGDDRNWMRVLSGRGECVYRSKMIQRRQHQNAVIGTIVEWSLVVPNAT